MIDLKRRKINLSAANLCATAGINQRTYETCMAGRYSPRATTLAKLKRALALHMKGFGAEAAQLAPTAALHATIALVAYKMRVDPREVLQADPSRRATMDDEWNRAAKVRRAALYVANQFFGFAQSDLARAANMSRQGISQAIKQLEDERDTDPVLKVLLDELEEVFS